jgi:hypothetical protein
MNIPFPDCKEQLGTCTVTEMLAISLLRVAKVRFQHSVDTPKSAHSSLNFL